LGTLNNLAIAITLLFLATLPSISKADPIHDAARTGDVAKVKKLLKANPGLANLVDRHTKLVGYTPLHYAAAWNRKTVAEVLIAYKADVNIKDESGETPLELAILYGYKDVVQVLAPGAKLTIFTAAGLGKTDHITLLLKKDKKLVHAKRTDGRTPLHLAAAGGQKAAVELLLENQADCNANSTGPWLWHRTPLHDAVSNGHKVVAELLLAHKANVNARNDRGQTPLHLAAEHGYTAVAEVLLRHKADVNATEDGVYIGPGMRPGVEATLFSGGDLSSCFPRYTSLHHAAGNGHKEVVKLLISHKAEVNARDRADRTPLHHAVLYNWKEVVEVLLGVKADINARDLCGETPLTWAIQRKHSDLVDFLRQHGGKE
jgi:ankyrin repeat protein